MSDVAKDIQKIIEKMPEAFQPAKAAGLNAVIQLNLTGEGGGQWMVKIANQQLKIDRGQASSPNLTLTMAAADYVALTAGKANPVTLFMAGRIKAEGNTNLAMKFQGMFDRE